MNFRFLWLLPLGALSFLAPTVVAQAELLTTAAERERLRGTPLALNVQPAALSLQGPGAVQQFVVTGRYADGTIRDLTPLADYRVEGPAVVEVGSDGLVRPRGNGKTTVLVRAGTASAFAEVTVAGYDRPEPVSFRREVVAALSVGGCNQGACHGTPSGKNGFKLSLRGFDPAADYLALTHDFSARRIERAAPESSLLLRKALNNPPHEGGRRFDAGSYALSRLLRWLEEGTNDDPPDLPSLRRLEVLPGSRIVHRGRWQQLAVLAHFSDGSVRDVTRLSNFSTSDEAIARVNGNGLVEFARPSEVAVIVRYLEELVPTRLIYLEPSQDLRWTDPPEANFVDRHVFAKLKLLGLPPAELSSDAVFLRRASLDLTGALPTPEVARAFLTDTSPDRRARLIDALLKHPGYADFWTLKWMDLLNANKQQIQIKGTHALHRWVHTQLERNRPIDEFARELLTASGSTFHNPPANFYRNDRGTRSPEDTAQNVAQLFLGVRMSCAKCHNHPFERWTQDDYYGLAAFFARVTSTTDPLNPFGNRFNQHALLISTDRGGETIHARTGKVQPPRLPGGFTPLIGEGQDRRVVFADWLTAPENPFFARAFVNRVWYHLFGRGIVEPVDDFRDSNPPASAELLDALAADFVAHSYDVQHLIRVILNSRTYQLSAVGEIGGPDGERFFARAVTRMLSAEQMLDALSDATGVPEVFKRTIPGGIGTLDLPLGTRAVQLVDGSVVLHPFLTAFGKPLRESVCECERAGDASLGHALQIINGPSVKSKLTDPRNRLRTLLAAKKADSEVLAELYLATLSRFPTEAEKKAILQHVAGQPDARKSWEDVQWALVNSKEFLFRH